MQSFKIIQPSPILHRYIRHYWILQSDMANAAPERTFPLGCIQLFFIKRSDYSHKPIIKYSPDISFVDKKKDIQIFAQMEI